MTDEIVIEQIRTADDFGAAFRIRDKVFVEEQGIPFELEHDEHDAHSIHVLARSGRTPVATARLTTGHDGDAVMARVAVLAEYRKSGIGRLLVKKLEELGIAAGVRRISLHPHHYLERFYADLGYRKIGGTHEVSGHTLITMEKHFDV